MNISEKLGWFDYFDYCVKIHYFKFMCDIYAQV